MVAVAFSYATANVYVRTVRHADPSRMALGQQVCSGLGATVLALILAGPSAFAPVVPNLVPLIALGALATALPMLLFMHLIRRTGPTRLDGGLPDPGLDHPSWRCCSSTRASACAS